MFSGDDITRLLTGLGVTHVVWVPDTTLGKWETALDESPDLELVRVCREGEAWGVAAGLFLGGAEPLVMIQCTGLFESGDALRNVVYDYGLPIQSLIGYRNFLTENSADTAKRFTEPILDAWGIGYRLFRPSDSIEAVSEYIQNCRATGQAGITLLAEGAG